jgi:hypothetical protein
MRNNITTLNRSELVGLIASAKKEEVRRCDADYASSFEGILALDESGERAVVEHVYWAKDGQACPPIKLLKKLFEDYPKAHTLSIEGTVRFLGGYGNIATQREESENAGYWSVEINR